MSRAVSPKVQFFFEGSNPNLKHRKKLKSFISLIFNKERRQLEAINFIFANDKMIHDINKKYLSHDFLTDVITFELSSRGDPVIAEVYISYDRVRENANIHDASFTEELHRVIFHGVLHLCGYTDKSLGQIRRMRSREDEYLSLYFG